MLKAKLSILLLVTYILTSTHVGELVKLPILAMHFLEHQHNNKRISVSDFLYKHYGNESSNDEHENNDKLPFKSVECCNNVVFSFCNPTPTYSFNLKLMENINTTISCHSLFFQSSNFHSKIWQPPKCS